MRAEKLRVRLNKSLEQVRVAIVTPTYSRSDFLAQAHRYFQNQNYAHKQNLYWCILDDTPQPTSLPFPSAPNIFYRHHSAKLTIGRKRNMLNKMAVSLGADIICAMDDDDWYGQNYVSDMVNLLMGTDFPFAGGSAIHYYVAAEDRIIHFDRPFGRFHSCNNLLAYKVGLLRYTSYDDTKSTGEEMSFTKRFKIPLIQHPDTKRVFLGLIHPNNVVPKDFISSNNKFATKLMLEDFIDDSKTIEFLRSIAKE